MTFALLACLAAVSPTFAGTLPATPHPTFPHLLSNTAPLAFGMDAVDAASALGVPLIYVRGRPGDETFLAIRDDGDSGFFPRNDRLYLQFRRGQLTGIKGDWGRNWMWR